MRKQKKKLVHYSAFTLFDGTVVAAHPIRKPIPKIIKQSRIGIDEDGICNRDWNITFKEFDEMSDERRYRLYDIMANRLNTRRAIRDIIIPHMMKMELEMKNLSNQLVAIQQLLISQNKPEIH